MVKRILITGGMGFIGKNLIKNLTNKNNNYQIIIIDNLSNSKISDIENFSNFHIMNYPKRLIKKKKGIYFYKGDIENKKLLSIVLKNVDTLVHLAANTGVEISILNPIKDLKKNILATVQLLELSRKYKIKKFIFSSSNAVIGNYGKKIDENSPTKPVNQYGVSKLSAESYINAYNKLYNIKTVILRFSNVYGPGSSNKNNIIPLFIKKLLKNDICFVHGDGLQTRDFVYIDDLCSAIIKCIKNNKISGKTFQIGSGKQTTILNLSKIIAKRISKIKNFPAIIKHAKSRKGDVRVNYSNINRAKEILSWQPTISLHTGINKTINYFTNEKKI